MDALARSLLHRPRGRTSFHKDFGNPAILYLFTGETRVGRPRPRRDALLHQPHRTCGRTRATPPCAGVPSAAGRASPTTFAIMRGGPKTVPGSVSLRRGHTVPVPPSLVGRGSSTKYRVEAISSERAQSLMASGGSGWPGAGKYGAINLVCRALQRGRDSTAFSRRTTLLKTKANSTAPSKRCAATFETTHTTRRDGQGWNPEGHGYAMFPGQYTFLFEILLNRHRGISLGSTHTLLQQGPLGHPFQGGLPYPVLDSPKQLRTRSTSASTPMFHRRQRELERGGARPTLAFYSQSPEHFGAGAEMGSTGASSGPRRHTWDAPSNGGLYALLYYPYDIEEQNPADIPGWGRWYYDPTFSV